ncbi:MAG TPA: type II 3-dehydroquinate dehydratase [Solirubrobacteraceae bacterium]|nr:type II 3-dehydroquinate dehydratase [Solirubrobacteraceae bacterium]
MSERRIAVLHGVNLNMLGLRDPAHYGTLTLSELEAAIAESAAEVGVNTEFFQTNHEGAYVERLQLARGRADGLILNPGAWTHYSWAIRDALELTELPAVEVHLSDINAREEFRRTSVIADLCVGTVAGRGAEGYADALALLARHLQETAA